MEAITAVSRFPPLPMIMVCPTAKPPTPTTGITVVPALVAVIVVVLPDVPTVAMTAVSLFVSLSIIIF
jgi:hypothetical protein